ncbi:hypothetical protein Bca4012_071287 [Brassica carinata]
MRVETDSDDDMLVPVFRTPVDVSGRGKRPMWNRLIFGILVFQTRLSNMMISQHRTTCTIYSILTPINEAMDDTLLDDTSSVCLQVSPAILPCRCCGRVGHNRATCRNLL